MKIIALDSSGLVASVALAEDDVLIAEYTTNHKKTHSQTLLPMLVELKKMVDLDLSTVDVIALAAGPGSFTGLRIGSATAKGLGLALNKPIAEVPTVDALAYNLYGTDKLVCPLMDARRSQVYTGIYEFIRKEEGYRLSALEKQCVLPIQEVAARLNALGREVIFLGDGVPVYQKELKEAMEVPFSFAPASCNRQRAAAVAVLGQLLAKEGRLVEAKDHDPEYLRVSQAEREREEAAKSGQLKELAAGKLPVEKQ